MVAFALPRLQLVNIASLFVLSHVNKAANVKARVFLLILSLNRIYHLYYDSSAIMSVKFEKDTITQTGGTIAAQSVSTAVKGPTHQLADELGVALTGGKGDVGQPGYLAVRDLSQ